MTVQPLPADWFVQRTDGVAAEVIRWATRSKVNHAGIYIGGGLSVEAHPQGAKVCQAPSPDDPNVTYSTGRLPHLERLLTPTARDRHLRHGARIRRGRDRLQLAGHRGAGFIDSRRPDPDRRRAGVGQRPPDLLAARRPGMGAAPTAPVRRRQAARPGHARRPRLPPGRPAGPGVLVIAWPYESGPNSFPATATSSPPRPDLATDCAARRRRAHQSEEDCAVNALSNADLWAMVVAFFSPHIIAVVQQPTWPRWARACVTVAASILIGVGGSYFGGTLFGPSGRPALTVGVVLGAIVVSTTAYEHLFKGAAQKIELATSKSPIGKGSMGATAPAVEQPVTLQVGDTTLDATIKATPKHARAKK